ncbi:MAG: AAA family ATPase, partial [Planctomycetia bacterium]|nr:AAA family ATPase [Planctomycetia bacterium]
MKRTLQRSSGSNKSYFPRVLDELGELLRGVPAIAIEGPKGVGKTATAAR